MSRYCEAICLRRQEMLIPAPCIRFVIFCHLSGEMVKHATIYYRFTKAHVFPCTFVFPLSHFAED